MHAMRPSLLVATLLLAGTAAACAHNAPAASPSPSVPAVASSPTVEPFHVESESVGGVHPTVTEKTNGRRVYALRALSEEADNSDTGHFEQPHIIFYAKDGTILIADSPQASIAARPKSVLMTGGVHARRQDGTTLTCRTLRYDEKSERIHAEGDVVLMRRGGTFTGDRLDSDVKFEHMHLWDVQ
jgi:LPS export ABC transporter protein LptC